MIDGLHVRLVNAFVAASSATLGRTLNETPERGSPSFRYVGRGESPVTVHVGIAGPAYGQIKFGMSLSTATRMASVITGRPIVTFDATTSDVLALLTERICGDALNELSGLGLALAAMDPTIVRSSQVRAERATTPSIVIPFHLGCGSVDLAVGLKLPQAIPVPGLALTETTPQPAAL